AGALQSGALLEGGQAEALDQPQGIEHELECALPGLDLLVAPDAIGRARGGEVLRRVPGLPAPEHAAVVPEGDLAVGAGTDAQVVAIAPVVEVVRALAAGQGVGTHFGLAVAGIG